MLSVDLESFGACARWDQLPYEVQRVDFPATARDPRFPGALLPILSQGGRVFWYAAAPDAATWRRLRPLLVAYAGPTVTSFFGAAKPISQDRPAERLLGEAGAFAIAALVPPPDGVRMANSALKRLVDALAHAPTEPVPLPVATSVLLARFEMCLASGDRTGAEIWLSQLRAEWRLDVLNLHFAEVTMFAAFRDWSEVVERPWFSDVCKIPKPPPVAHAMLEALWQTRLVRFESDHDELLRRYNADVRRLSLDLLADALPMAEEGAGRIAELEMQRSAAPRTADTASSPLHLNILGESQQGWIAWADEMESSRDARRFAAAAARDAATRQPANDVRSSSEATEVAGALHRLAERGGRDAVLAALPILVRWLQDDPDYPRSEMQPLYDAVLTLFAYLEDRGQSARDALLGLLDSMLSLGVSIADYRRLLQDAETQIDDEAGATSIYWLLDLTETLLRHPAPDGAARLLVLNKVLSSMRGILGLLTQGQRYSYTRVATAASWPQLPPPESDNVRSQSMMAALLSGKTVAVYTLTEAAGRQAKDALAEMAPEARVELADDHVCSPRLQALARNSEIFVLATTSAKHAATDCVQRHRPKGALVLYAAGRGVTSILRAIEAHVEAESNRSRRRT